MLFELLTGQLPFEAVSEYEYARKVCEEDVVFPTVARRACCLATCRRLR